MEQEQKPTPKDEGHKADGSMPEQPERDPKTSAPEGAEEQTPTPADTVAETKPAEDTGDKNPVCGDDVDPGEGQADEADGAADAEAEDQEKERAAEETDAEAESEGGERNE